MRKKTAKVIQAPVDISYFSPDRAPPDDRIMNSLGIKVISIGNVNQVKGYELFIEAASYVNRSNNDVSFWIIGPIYTSQIFYYKKLKRLAKKLGVLNLYFYGQSDEIRSILKACIIAETSLQRVWARPNRVCSLTRASRYQIFDCDECRRCPLRGAAAPLIHH